MPEIKDNFSFEIIELFIDGEKKELDDGAVLYGEYSIMYNKNDEADRNGYAFINFDAKFSNKEDLNKEKKEVKMVLRDTTTYEKFPLIICKKFNLESGNRQIGKVDRPQKIASSNESNEFFEKLWEKSK